MPQIEFAIFDIGQVIYPYTLAPLDDLMKSLAVDKDGRSALEYDYNPYMRGELTAERFAQELCLFCHVKYNKKLLPPIDEALHRGRGKEYPQTLEAMCQFRKKGVKIGVLSNAIPALNDEYTELVEPEFVFVSYNMGLLKPDVKIYQTMAKKLKTSYEKILFIDDKEINIRAAQSLGINGIIFKPETILQEIEPYL